MLLKNIDDNEIDREERRFTQVFWSQSGEDIVLERLFRGQRGGYYVDIGAHDPFKFSNTYLLHRYYGWAGVNVDASPHTIERFQTHRPSDTNLRALVGTAGTVHTFTEYDGRLVSTAREELKDKILERGRTVVAEHQMKAVCLKDLLDEHVPHGQQIDLMTIDVEGFDLDALHSSDWQRFRPTVVCVEDLDRKRNEDTEIHRFMMGANYICVSVCYETSIYRAR